MTVVLGSVRPTAAVWSLLASSTRMTSSTTPCAITSSCVCRNVASALYAGITTTTFLSANISGPPGSNQRVTVYQGSRRESTLETMAYSRRFTWASRLGLRDATIFGRKTRGFGGLHVHGHLRVDLLARYTMGTSLAAFPLRINRKWWSHESQSVQTAQLQRLSGSRRTGY